MLPPETNRCDGSNCSAASNLEEPSA